ncbi:MAG TPA: hypothetical protein PLY40_07750 [Bacillota bacterium]|nr:hypothetical protein [Bacillota bacterium]
MKKKLVLAIMTITLVAAMVSGASYSWYTDLASVGPNIFTAAELLVTEGLVLWLDASDADTLTLDGNKVVGWADKSGNGNDAKQLNVNNQPTYESNVINGKPVVRFDGIDDFMDGVSSPTIQQSGTLFIVARNNAAAGKGEHIFFSHSLDSGNRRLRIDMRPIDGTPTLHIAIANRNNVITEGKIEDQAGHLISLNWDTGNFSVDLDGVNLTLPVSNFDISSFPFTPGFYRIGDYGQQLYQHSFGGDIAEIIIYNRALDDDEREAVESYLSKKYGLALGEAEKGPASASMSSGFEEEAPDGEDTGQGEIDGPGLEEPSGKNVDPVVGPGEGPGEASGGGPGEGSGGDAGAGSGAGAGDGSGEGAQKTPGAASDEGGQG